MNMEYGSFRCSFPILLSLYHIWKKRTWNKSKFIHSIYIYIYIYKPGVIPTEQQNGIMGSKNDELNGRKNIIRMKIGIYLPLKALRTEIYTKGKMK